MSNRTRIPSAIDRFIQVLPETALVLLTGTVGCSPSWLAACFVSAILTQWHDEIVEGINTGRSLTNGNYGMILISWMRDLTFWKTQIRRTTGLDINKAEESSRFTFVDCLTQLLSNDSEQLASLEKTVKEAIEKLHKPTGRRVILILDNPDVLLATTSITAHQLNTTVFKLRSMVHSTLIACSVDMPLLAAATQTHENSSLPLEAESARFITQQAHNAHYLMSVQELRTGAARDVSGVLRVTRSACAYELEEAEEARVREMEALYLVQRDGSVKVFERGANAM